MAPARETSTNREVLHDFLPGQLMDRLDVIEFGKTPRLAKHVHEGVQEWISHAVAAYVAASEAVNVGGPVFRPVPRWTYKYRFPGGMSGRLRELKMTAWARCYSTADDQVREIRLMVNRLNGRAREDRERAVAAMVAAEGTTDSRPHYVRVREVGLLEAESRVIFEGDHDTAVEFYRKVGRPALNRILSAEEYRSCSACVDCDFAAVCEELRYADGLTGPTNSSRPRRSWSVTNGRSYVICPARDYLRRQHLPTEYAIEHSADATRGRAIHDYLALRHAARLPCVPEIPEDWVPEGYMLSEEDRKLSMRMLIHHAEVCPVSRAAALDIRVEEEQVFDDRSSNVLVVAKPDLLYSDGGGRVWRELKSHRRSWHSKDGLLAENPQLALAVLLLHRGDLGGIRERNRIELEILRPSGVDIKFVDPSDPAVVVEARRIIHGMIEPWHADDLFAAKAGPHCAKCEVARWCPSRFEPETAA